jgi:hypothetical protein
MELNAETGRPDRSARVAGADVAAEGEVKIVPGGAVDLINLSETGALVEGKSRLAVGTPVTVCLGGDAGRRLAGKVVRCNVSAIHRDSTMSYQVGIAFDEAAAVDVVAALPVNEPVQETVAVPPPASNPAAEIEELVNEW